MDKTRKVKQSVADEHSPQWSDLRITIEGCAQSGKSTIASVIANALEQAGISCIVQQDGDVENPSYEKQYADDVALLRKYLQEQGTDEIEDRKITIVEKTV